MLLYTIQAIYTKERVRVHLECRHKWPQNSQNKWIYLSIILLSQYIFVSTVHISPSSYMPCIRATTTAINQPEKWTQQLLNVFPRFGVRGDARWVWNSQNTQRARFVGFLLSFLTVGGRVIVVVVWGSIRFICFKYLVDGEEREKIRPKSCFYFDL